MINSKQRAALRSMGNGLDAIFQIGKDGITPNLVKSVDEALEKRELVKLSILENSSAEVREACRTIAERTRAEEVQCIGRRFLLYRESKKNKKIDLENLR